MIMEEGFQLEVWEKPGYVTADKFSYKYIKEARDKMKKNQTPAEQVVWEQLRAKKMWYKIRRKHIIDNFFVDFVCLSQKLIIEIDWEIHSFQKERDELRTERLSQLGYKVMRFDNKEVLWDINGVIRKVKQELGNSPPPLEGLGEVQNLGNHKI